MTVAGISRTQDALSLFPPAVPKGGQPSRAPSLGKDRFVPSASPSLPRTQNNQAKLLVDSSEVLPELLKMIGAAQQEVQIDTFLFGGTPGDQLADALIAKMRAGVQVRLMYDPGEGHAGSLKKSMEATLARLKAAGADLKAYPLDKMPKYRLPGQNSGQIDHDKLLVVDGSHMVLGGMNWVDQGVVNRDLMVRLDGPAAQQLSQLLNDDWAAAECKPSPAPPCDATAPGQASVELTVTGRDRQDTKPRLLKLFNDAKKSIFVGIYQLDDPDLVRALIRAKTRGVDVRVLMSRNDRYSKYVPIFGSLMNGMPNQASAIRLKQAGVDVRWYDPRNPEEEMHAKYAVVDHQTVAVGSTNFTEKSFKIIRETEAFIQDRALASDTEQRMFLEDWTQRSTPVSDPGFWTKAFGKMVEFLRDVKISWW